MATDKELWQVLISRALIRLVLINAEDDGRIYNGTFGADNVPCTYWIVGNYIVTYITDDEDFDASMITEDMLDDLIIEER